MTSAILGKYLDLKWINILLEPNMYTKLTNQELSVPDKHSKSSKYVMRKL